MIGDEPKLFLNIRASAFHLSFCSVSRFTNCQV
nr:MAG TPA: hypothetical protein [Caudoviricetes sp.]